MPGGRIYKEFSERPNSRNKLGARQRKLVQIKILISTNNSQSDWSLTSLKIATTDTLPEIFLVQERRMLAVDMLAVFKSRPSMSTGRRNFCKRQSVEIVSGSGTITSTPFFLLNIPITVKQVPSMTYLRYAKLNNRSANKTL